jgi:hypothetical protein
MLDFYILLNRVGSVQADGAHAAFGLLAFLMKRQNGPAASWEHFEHGADIGVRGLHQGVGPVRHYRERTL